jgi:hypothetical protein
MAGSNVEALKAQAAVVRGINASLRRVSEQLDSMMDALDRTVELSFKGANAMGSHVTGTVRIRFP